MQVKYCKSLMPGQMAIARVEAIAWSANNKRLAVADPNLHVQLFDETGERRDKFPSKSSDGKSHKNYSITGLAFSPDSTRIAVAQSDSIISIYRIGLEWGEKKSICNKFPQSASVTCVTWPNTSSQGVELIAFGLSDGKVKVGLIKSNKSQTLYSHDHAVMSMSCNRESNKLVCGHIDGAVFVYVFEADEGASEPSGAKKLFMHSCPPAVLSWGEHLCAAGADCLVTFYNPQNGQKVQTFDFPIKEEGAFTAGGFNPSGQSIVVASRDLLRVFDFNIRSRKWEDGVVLHVGNAVSFSQVGWKQDGSRLVTGTVTGAVDMFDACLKRYRLRGAFEFTYVSYNQVIVKRLATGTRIVLRSNQGNEVQSVNVYKDRYLVAHTSTTLLVGDLVSCKLSEVPWQLTGKEKFVFDSPDVCMVFTAGELCLIEYGQNTLLGTCRTEERNAHRISVRVHNPPQEDEGAMTTTQDAAVSAAATAAAPDSPKRVLAFLIDRQTIQVDDFISGVSIARISHNVRIDWLELDYRASKLLFRDKQHQLFLYDIPTQQRTTLLNYCTYVQWVPGSDVVVAQNRLELCVWYSIESPDRVTIVPIRGEVEGIERGKGKTEVIVDEGINTVAYGLDEALIEFGTTMEERQYDRACDLLDRISLTPETEAMWSSLSTVALKEMRLPIAERCFAAMGDVAKVKALRRLNALASKASREANGATDGYDHYTVRAELYILNKAFKRAEQVYLENGKVAEAIQMWEEMGCFDESITIAEQRGLDDLPNRRARYFSWLMETRQFEKAGEVKEKEGKHMDAINLYLRGGTPARAANVITVNNMKPEQQLLEAVAAALFKAQVFEKAGDFFEKLRMEDRALEAYVRGRVFGRAVEYAKRVNPQRVARLEEAWGDYLVSQKQVDLAINHYAEAGNYSKAVKAAISSRQWNKASEILETQNMTPETDPAVATYFKTIARHYETIHEYAEAEKYYIRANAINDAVEMYSRAGMPDHMYRVAQRHLKPEELVNLFVSQAQQLEAKGDYAGAERIYVKINEVDKAIVMYKRTRDYTNMIRLVQAYHPEFLLKTHVSLGMQFEKEKNYKAAEAQYVAGKDWGRAVNMYRELDMWDDAVRVAKVHGGANASKQVVLSRAMVIDAEEGVRLLGKFSLLDSGIDAALEAQKFDLALQWAQTAMPAKVPYVYLKYAMHYEDMGDFRMAEDAFIKSGKPREAIDMYVHQHEFSDAMRVAESYDPSAIPNICSAHGRTTFQQGNYQEAETLFLRAGAPESLLKLFMDARMYSDAQRVAKEHCPEMQGEVAKRIALQSNDPQKAGAVLEESGEYQLAIDTYLGATVDVVPDMNQLANIWVRAVKVAQKHARNALKDVLKQVTARLRENQRYVEAGKCLEDCEDYKGAINMYVQGKKFDMAEALAKRISPELEDYVKRAIVQDSIEGGNMKDAKVVEEMDPEAAMKAYIEKGNFEDAIRMARGRSEEDHKYVTSLWIQQHLRDDAALKAIEVLEKNPIDYDDFRFYPTWMEMCQKVILLLPCDELDVSSVHTMIIKVSESMSRSGQKPEDVAKANALMHVVHAYHQYRKMRREYNLPQFAVKLMLGLPRWIPHIAPDKAFYDAGMAAKAAVAEGMKEMEDIAFLYLNRTLDIAEHIEDGDYDAQNIENTDFDTTDFPRVYHLPRSLTVPASKMEEVNSWVLTTSIEKTVQRTLPTIKDPQTQEPMFEGSLKAPQSGNTYPECAVTGYPIVGGGLTRCVNCQRPSNQADWNKLVVVAKRCPWCDDTASPDFKL